LHKDTIKLFLLLVTILVTQTPVAASAENVSEYKIKAGFIYNFAKFTKWPDESDDLKICIYGKDPFGNTIDSLDGKQSSDRVIKIFRTKNIDEIKTCHIAFLNIIPPERHLFERALQKIKGTHVLTVADAANVTEFGVIIGMRINNDKIAFDVNHTVAQASNLEISAKLLRLASEVN